MRLISAFLILITMGFLSCGKKDNVYKSYDDYPQPENAHLWLKFSPESSTFSIWSPIAEKVKLNLFKNGDGGSAYESHDFKSGEKGVWTCTVKEDLQSVYYTFQIKTDGKWLDETPGIYAQAVGVNGMRAMVINLDKTNPENWSKDKGPANNCSSEAIIYELHVRDVTIHPNSGSSFPGKYLGLIEPGTKGPGGLSTGIDHIVDLGVTHVHLLPSYDHYAIDESKLDSAQFNWGYDPQNYNAPEGSFSSDPFNAEVRISEFKKMVKGFHDRGIGVILDVVYNHTGRTEESNFNLEVPGYYYRHNEDGSWSNASACGNETASERLMMRKYMVESVLYWAKEFHLDGFRFDLMGIHDIETMNAISSALKTFNPNILIYGEGWTAGTSPLPEEDQALKKHTYRLKDISAFTDDLRDGLKGSVFEEKETGFVSGASGKEESIKFGVVGSIFHDQINYTKVNYSDTAWTIDPWQAVSYVSCHDNNTLYDKLILSRADASPDEIKKMHKLANAIVLTTQGMAFLHAGVEMMRTKGGAENSFNMPDEVNRIDWQWKVSNWDVFEYYKALVNLRKNHPALRMKTGEMVRTNLRFLNTEPGLVAFVINGTPSNDSWKEIVVIYNSNVQSKEILLEGDWTLAIYDDKIDEAGIGKISGKVEVPAISALLAFKK